MFTKVKLFSITLLALLACLAFGTFEATAIQAQSLTSTRKSSSRDIEPAAGGSQFPVVGSGTLGKLTKWTGLGTSNSTIGDANIYEDKFGKVGVGTTMPTSPLTVQGMIETTLGGIKFPDGTMQSTAAVSGLQAIFHDSTLTGNGTSASPLGLPIPLNLTGVSAQPILSIVNGSNGDGIVATAGSGGAVEDGGAGARFIGGDSLFARGGPGLTAQGGSHTGSAFAFDGGAGIRARGGDSAAGFAGSGVVASGGTSTDGHGGDGIDAFPGDPDGFAGFFDGFVEVNGSLRVDEDLSVHGTKNFKIDHPLDPANKYLLHAAIESSEVLNVYSGNVVTNENGEAIVTLPDWFEAINRDFRYQLTVVGTFAQAIIAEKIKGNRFSIKSNTPNVEVSWQVTGVRSDLVMVKRPFKTEQDKPERERGTYLGPELYGQPEERGIGWSHRPELMQSMKERREQAKQIQQ